MRSGLPVPACRAPAECCKPSDMSDLPISLRDPAAPEAERVLILDFGSQVTQLIARRVRESGRLLRDLAVQRGPRPNPRLRRAGIHPLRRPGQRDRGHGPPRAGHRVRSGRTGARHLLWPADDVRAARRRGASLRSPRVRPRRSSRSSSLARCSAACGRGAGASRCG